MDRIRIRFITPCAGEDFFGPVKKGMHDAGAMLNADCSFVGTEDVDIPAQVAMVEEAVRDGVQGIALSIADPDAFTDAVGRAAARGIPTVAFNIDASEGRAGDLGAVLQDVYKAGRTVGELSARHVRERGMVLATVHSQGVTALEARLRGMQEALAPKGLRWKTVCTGIRPEAGARIISAELEAGAPFEAVLCTGQADTEAAGMASALLPEDRRPFIAGFDLSPRILDLVEEGVIAFTIDQQPYLQGFLPVVQLCLYLRYGIRPGFVDAGAVVIDRAHARQVIEQSRAGYR